MCTSFSVFTYCTGQYSFLNNGCINDRFIIFNMLRCTVHSMVKCLYCCCFDRSSRRVRPVYRRMENPWSWRASGLRVRPAARTWGGWVHRLVQEECQGDTWLMATLVVSITQGQWGQMTGRGNSDRERGNKWHDLKWWEKSSHEKQYYTILYRYKPVLYKCFYSS